MMRSEDVGPEEEDCESGLDEFGWDPMVDEYLEALVEEAQDESEIDWAWISCQFLETLEPTQDQIHAALERFSPQSLQERWSYLQNRSVLATQEAANSLNEPARDRVLEAMQNFLFGLPSGMNPHRHETAEAKPHEVEESEAPADLGLQQEAETDSADAGDISNDTGRAEHEETVATFAAGENPRRFCESDRAAKGTDALRRCLEELRWHGEALRQCAAGANAQQLCAEASVRRKELLWSLGREQEKKCWRCLAQAFSCSRMA